MNHQVYHGDSYHRLAAVDQGLVIFAQPSVLSQPGEGALDDPAFGQNLESAGIITTLDDLQRPAAKGSGPFNQLPGISAIRPDQLQPPEGSGEFRQHQLGPVAILQTGGMHHHAQDQAQGIDDDMPLAAVDFLPRVKTAYPPFSVVFTDWLSMTAAVGVGFLPSATRTFSRSLS